jgi:hypothetical protein
MNPSTGKINELGQQYIGSNATIGGPAPPGGPSGPTSGAPGAVPFAAWPTLALTAIAAVFTLLG